jgi:hypothetical protein
MVTVDNRPDAGGNTDQPDDGRDAQGRLPAPLDAALYPDGGLPLPGLPLGQPASDAGTADSDPDPDPDPERGPSPEEKAPTGLTTTTAGALVGAPGLAKAKRSKAS